MITMEYYAQIRHAFYLEKKSIRQIAAEFQVSRQSVRKALDNAQPPGYQRKKPRAAPTLDPFKARIKELFDQNNRLPRKQRYTARRIYQLLCTEGYTGSESTVRAFVGHLRQGTSHSSDLSAAAVRAWTGCAGGLGASARRYQWNTGYGSPLCHAVMLFPTNICDGLSLRKTGMFPGGSCGRLCLLWGHCAAHLV
jgi:transposase